VRLQFLGPKQAFNFYCDKYLAEKNVEERDVYQVRILGDSLIRLFDEGIIVVLK
jgi:hypothetical protein